MRLSATSTSVTSKSVAGSSGSGGVALPAYLTNTDDLIYYIDFQNTSSYSGSGSSVTDLSDSGFTTTIHGTEDTHWEYISSESGSSNPAWYRKNPHHEGFITATTSSSENFGFGTGDFSIELWIRPNSYNYSMLFLSTVKDTSDNTVSGDPKAYMFLSFTGRRTSSSDKGKLYCYLRDFGAGGSGAGPNGTENTYADTQWPGYISNGNAWGDWLHVAFTRSGTSHKLYQNTTEVGSITSTTTYDFDSSNNYALSLLDDLRDTSSEDYARFAACRVYKGTALSSSDITAHYDGEKAAYGH